MSAAFDAFKSQLVYEAEQPVDTVLADLEQIAAYDYLASTRRGRYLRLLIISGIVAFAATIASFILVLPPLFLLGMLAIVIFIVSFVLRRGWPDFSSTRRRYQLVTETLNAVGRDMAANAPITVRLVLTAPNASAKRTGAGEAQGWKVTYFADPWLTLRGRLVDGTGVRIGMIEKHQDRTKWKRSSSGKQKRKTKTKSSTQATVELRPKRAVAERLPAMGETQRGQLQLPPWLLVKNCETADGTVGLTVGVAEDWAVRPAPQGAVRDGREIVVRSLLGLYTIVRDARAQPTA